MPGTNLTQAEAAQRSALVRLESYAVELDLTRPDDTYASTTVLRFGATTPGAGTFVDLVAPAVHEVVLNGERLDPAQVYADGRIAIGPLAAQNELRVVASCAYMNTGEGLHRSVDPADGNTYLYTHFEIPEARRVFTTFEQPDLKAPFTFTVIAPAGWTVLSNSPTPAPESLGEGRAVWRFTPTPPISTYLTAIAAGPYHLEFDTYTAKSGQVIPLAVGCRASLAAHLDPAEIFEVTKQGFDYYLDAFDTPYPFVKYDQLFAPEYNIGAMENIGLVTITEEYLFDSKVTDAEHQARAETILHELAHMWFGNLVTMHWWDDLWLKESVATYVSNRCLAEATRWPHSWVAFANADKAWGLRQDQLPSTHPIVATIADLDDVQFNFDGITYAKGAAVLKQLVAWVGDEAFFAGMRTYFRRHAWGTTTLADLLDALDAGRDLAEWSAQWLQTAGPNTLRPEYEVGPDGTFTSFAVGQEAPAEHPTLRSHRIAVGLYARDGSGALVRVRRVELDVAGERTEVPELVGVARPDLVLVNDDDLTYAALRLDEHSLDTVLTSIADLADPLPRALCWAATWDMLRHAELGARDFLALVLGAASRESDISVVRSLLQRVVQTLDGYVAPEHRAATAATVAAAARRELQAAPSGGDAQLAWARLFAQTAGSPDDLDYISALLEGPALPDGTAQLPGLVLDAKMRWSLFAALVREGRVGEPEIAAELDRDRTTTGEEYAAGARAALPTAEAKAWAWASLIDRPDLPNRTQDSLIGGPYSPIGVGFTQATQPELTAPYIDRYFAALPEVWATRTLEIARNIVTGLYPRLHAGPAVLAATDEFLDGGERPPGLRRLLLEARAEAQRSIAARERDRAAG